MFFGLSQNKFNKDRCRRTDQSNKPSPWRMRSNKLTWSTITVSFELNQRERDRNRENGFNPSESHAHSNIVLRGLKRKEICR
jgi:hypothetical protein